MTPNNTIPSMTRVVMTGRRMKISLMLIVRWRGRVGGAVVSLFHGVAGAQDIWFHNRRSSRCAHHFSQFLRHGRRASKGPAAVDDAVRDPQRRPSRLVLLIPNLDLGAVVHQVLGHQRK